MITLTEWLGKQEDEWLKTAKNTNIDDIFRGLHKENIAEIEVTKEQMILIVEFYVANLCDYIHGFARDKNRLKSTGAFKGKEDVSGLELLRTGTVDMFFGIKLHVK
jgi:hypothetical protein